MELNGLHLLLTYRCLYSCNHCFLWGSPGQSGVMDLAFIVNALDQAKAVGVEWIYFEGGEPFLYYPVLVNGVKMAGSRGFNVGIVTNAYWAVNPTDAKLYLEPMAGLVGDLAVSRDDYHRNDQAGDTADNALEAAKELGIPTGPIAIGCDDVSYRGRAAMKLASDAEKKSPDSFTQCPHEDFNAAGRIHLDPFGNLHICQGLIIGNILQKPLKDILSDYDPNHHPIIGPLMVGGPFRLAKEIGIEVDQGYADHCHLCYSVRSAVRERYPELLGPDNAYGEPD